MRLHNKTILDKPFTFDVNPAYSTNAKFFRLRFVVENYRNTALYNTLFTFGCVFYADALFKVNPMVR
jgi:hypothetical protein